MSNPGATSLQLRVTAGHLRTALAQRGGVIVWLPTVNAVDAVPGGLTRVQSEDPDVVVLLTEQQAAAYLAAADGSHAKAARDASVVLAWQSERGWL